MLTVWIIGHCFGLTSLLLPLARQKALDELMGLGRCPVSVASTASQDASLTIDQEIGWRCPYGKECGYFELLIQKVREAYPMLGQKIFDGGHRLPHVDGHDG
jgi:hypothetical protein